MRHRLNLFIELKLLGLPRNVLNEPFFKSHNSQFTTHAKHFGNQLGK